MLIFFVVVVSVLGGVALCGLAVFFYFFYKAIQRLTAVTEDVQKLVQPMSGGNLLPDLLKAIQKQTALGKDGVLAMNQMAQVVSNLNRLFSASAGQPAVEGAMAASAEEPAIDVADQTSWFKAPTEEDMAKREQVDEARKAGVAVDEEPCPGGEPSLSAWLGVVCEDRIRREVIRAVRMPVVVFISKSLDSRNAASF